MWKVIVLCLVIGMVMSAEGAYRKRYAGGSTGGYAGGSTGSYAGGSAGGYAGAGTGSYSGGYGGGGYGGGGYGGGYDDFDYGYAPDFGFIDPFQFHQQLTAQILAQNNAIASTFSSGPASATADASSLPDDINIQQQIAQQQAYFDGVRRQNHYSNGGYKSHRYAPNYAAASGSIGPGGHYQTAFISPENPAIPNVSNRFGGSSSPGGYKGVSVSSFSSSADINGHKTGQRGAQTTINDNGKITTYRVHS